MVFLFALLIMSNGVYLYGSCPPVTGPVAQFCNLNVRDQLCVNNQLVVSATGTEVFGLLFAAPSGQVVPSFGNTLRVDQVYGLVEGQRDGIPFLTIGAALAAAQPGDFVWVFPGTYNETLVIPEGVAVVGVSSDVVIIQQLDVASDTDLITMGENSQLANVTLKLTSASQVDLRGIVFPGTTTMTSQVLNSSLTVDNSGAGAGTSNVYGVHSTGTGLPAIEKSTLITSSITVNSTGSGLKRGILVDSASGVNTNDTAVLVTGGVNVIGVEVNNAAASFNSTSSNIGGDTADISQTSGTLSISSTNLIHSTANGFGFNTASVPGTIVWVEPSSFAPSGFLSPGTAIVSPTPTGFIPVSQKFLAKSVAAHAEVPPGGAETITFTILINGNPTALAVTLTGNQTDNVNTTNSAHFSVGDTLALVVTNSALSNAQFVSATVDIY